MDLIERYVYAVKRTLPESKKDYAEKEVRELIQGKLEKKGGYSDKAVEEVLNELGNPRLLAEKYAVRHNYLIGPELYELYLNVVKIAVPVIACLAVFGTTVESVVNSYGVSKALVKVINGAVNAGIGTFGVITLIFALVERKYKEEFLKEIYDNWSIKELPEVKKVQKPFNQAGVIAGIVFNIIFIIFLNSFNELIGIYFNAAGGEFYPLLNQTVFEGYLPYINILLLLQLLFQSSKLFFRKWTYGMAAANMLLNAATLILFIYILKDPSLVNNDFITEAAKYKEGAKEGISIALVMLRNVLYVVIPFAILLDTIEGFYNAYKNIKEKYN